MFLQSLLFVILGFSLRFHNISSELCHLTNPDVAVETDAADVIIQCVASNNVTYNVSRKDEIHSFIHSFEIIDVSQNESDPAAVRFFVTRILKGKWRMPNIQSVSIASDAVPVKDHCGSAITEGSKYLIFLRNVSQDLTWSSTSVVKQEVVNLIVLSSKETVKLVLHKSMRINTSPPLAKLAERELIISAGMRIRLVCHTSGSPTPVVRWYKNKNLLFPDVRMQLNSKSYESELVIWNAELQDAGHYKCQASNHLGTSNAVRTIVHVTAVGDNIRNRSYSTRCVDDAFCFNQGRCFQTHVLGHRFCRCSPGFGGVRCAVRKSISLKSVDGRKKTEQAIFHPKIGVVVIIVAIVILVSVSLLILIANLARKMCQSRVDYYDNPVSSPLRQISPQFPHRSQVEITNLVFTEHTMSSVSNLGDSDGKRSLDLSVDLSPQDAAAKSKGDGIEDSFQNESEKSVPIELKGDSDSGNRNYERCIATDGVYDSDNSDCCHWRLHGEQMSDLEVHRESDIDLVEVEPPSGDDLYCPSRGISEMSSHCDTTSRTSTSMDCESTSSADLSQRLLRHLYAFPQMGEPEQEREEQEEDMSLEEFLGQHCIAMGALPDLKDYLGTMAIDESLTGSYPGSKNFTSEV